MKTLIASSIRSKLSNCAAVPVICAGNLFGMMDLCAVATTVSGPNFVVVVYIFLAFGVLAYGTRISISSDL